jgi:type IV pilus assembly protein PilN
MRRINLLPPEERRRGAVSGGGGAPGGVIGILLILGVVAAIFMVAIYVFFLFRLGAVNDEIAALDEQIATQQARVQELQPFQDLQARLDAKKPIADGIYRTRFPWDEFLSGLSFVIPDATALEGLTGQAAPVNVTAQGEGEPLTPTGTVTFTGIALDDYQNIADFVVRMNNLRFLANSQLNTAELDRETFVEPAINFEVSSQLITEIGENGTEVRLGPGTLEETEDPEADVGEQAISINGERR